MTDSLSAVFLSDWGERIPLSWFVQWSEGSKNPIYAAFVASRWPRYMLMVVKDKEEIVRRVRAKLRLSPTADHLDWIWTQEDIVQYLKETY